MKRIICTLTIFILLSSSVQSNDELPDLAIYSSNPYIRAQDRIFRWVSQKNLMKNLEFLASDEMEGRACGSNGEDMAREFIEREFESYGLDFFEELGLKSYTHEFEIPAKHGFVEREKDKFLPCENIIGVLRGSEISEFVVISAHYDHLGRDRNGVYNGADDNASGVSTMLEIARVLSKLNLKPRRSLLFVAFSAEESGLYGSKALLKMLSEKNLSDDVVVLNLDMVGEGTKEYLEVWGINHPQNKKLIELNRLASKHFGVEVRFRGETSRTDAETFSQEGIPSIFYSWGDVTEHPNYHTVRDDAEYIKEKYLKTTTQFVAEVAWALANDLVFDAEREDIRFSDKTPLISQKIEIKITLQNLSETSAFDVLVQVFDGAPRKEALIYEEVLGEVKASEKRVLEFSWSFSEVGIHNISVLVDPENEIEEISESNNFAFNTLYVHGSSFYFL
ncbi:MAG: M28 family metallopeptidase [Candidatus Methanofastidiosia archaeon]